MMMPLRITLICILTLAAAVCGADGVHSVEKRKTDSLIPQVLHPAYWDWVKRPGEMLGFWLWTGPQTMQDITARTGANATSFHTPMWIAEDDESPLGVKVVPASKQIDGWGPAAGILKQLGTEAGVDIGEHNNACFVRYGDWFWAKHPNSAMRDKNGRVIKIGNNTWPAMNDPVLTTLGKNQMTDMARLLKDETWVRYWVLGGEQGYPDYFGRPVGDYRPAARRHYRAWQIEHGLPPKPRFGEPQWNEYRESAVVDHFGNYTAYLRAQDPTRPILIPTHGNPFALDLRPKLGYPLGGLAGAADGFESGPIAIDDDNERLIRMTLDQQTSFGIPVTAPRLADKRLDPTAKGGGRSFSPASLRRFVYEGLGLGVWHLGLVQWSGVLADGEWGISGTPAEAECRKVFSEIKQAAPYLENCSRLQAQVGLFISDAEWRRHWRDRWTLLYDCAIKRGWQVATLDDAQIDADLVKNTPAIISVDNSVVAGETRAKLRAYIKAGGKVIYVGDFAIKDDEDRQTGPVAGAVMLQDNAPGEIVTVIHQTQTVGGANTWKAQVRRLPLDEIEKIITKAADLRQIEITDAETGNRAEGVECLPLTDGTNITVVVINRNDQPRKLRIRPSKRLEAETGSMMMRNAVSGEEMTGGSDSIPAVSLDSFGTALISFEPKITPDEVKQELHLAQEAVKRWTQLGTDTTLQKDLLSRSRDLQKTSHSAKALALARTILHSLAFKVDITKADDALKMKVSAWSPDGNAAAGTKVRLRFVPGPFRWRELEETTPGAYMISLPAKSLPRSYNPSTERYDIPDGALQYILDASRSNLIGGMRGVMPQSLPSPSSCKARAHPACED